jgi:hypothetical protein
MSRVLPVAGSHDYERQQSVVEVPAFRSSTFCTGPVTEQGIFRAQPQWLLEVTAGPGHAGFVAGVWLILCPEGI